MITFSCYNAHTSPIFKDLYTMKFLDVIIISIVSPCLNFIIICYLLLSTLFFFVTPIASRHKYKTVLDWTLKQLFVFLLPGLIIGSSTIVLRGLFFGIM